MVQDRNTNNNGNILSDHVDLLFYYFSTFRFLNNLTKRLFLFETCNITRFILIFVILYELAEFFVAQGMINFKLAIHRKENFFWPSRTYTKNVGNCLYK